ncbi:ZP3 protein, partial [Polypterus senegalus]|nr:ZP3 protein [Polypterus senegalus]
MVKEQISSGFIFTIALSVITNTKLNISVNEPNECLFNPDLLLKLQVKDTSDLCKTGSFTTGGFPLLGLTNPIDDFQADKWDYDTPSQKTVAKLGIGHSKPKLFMPAKGIPFMISPFPESLLDPRALTGPSAKLPLALKALLNPTPPRPVVTLPVLPKSDVSLACSLSKMMVRVKKAFFGFGYTEAELVLGNNCKSNGKDEATTFSKPSEAKEYHLGQEIHFQVASYPDRSRQWLFLHSCFATPSPNPNSSPRYTVIDNYGCMVDSKQESCSSRFERPRIANVVSFTVSAFQFNDHKQVYFHCKMFTKKSQDVTNTAKFCTYNKKLASLSNMVVKVKKVFFRFGCTEAELLLGNDCKSSGRDDASGDLLFNYPLNACGGKKSLPFPSHLKLKNIIWAKKFTFRRLVAPTVPDSGSSFTPGMQLLVHILIPTHNTQ